MNFGKVLLWLVYKFSSETNTEIEAVVLPFLKFTRDRKRIGRFRIGKMIYAFLNLCIIRATHSELKVPFQYVQVGFFDTLSYFQIMGASSQHDLSLN